MLLLPLIALSILSFTQSCAPTVTPDFIDYGTLQTTTTSTTSTTSTTTTTTSPTTTSTTTSTSTTTTTASPCPIGTGFTLEADGRCYRFFAAGIDEPTAEANCQAIGSTVHLATIRTQQQNDIVNSLAGPGVGLWIGVVKIQPVATCGATPPTCFKYVDDNSTPIVYYNPNAGQTPSDTNECTLLNGDNSFWYFTACSAAGYSYICSYQP